MLTNIHTDRFSNFGLIRNSVLTRELKLDIKMPLDEPMWLVVCDRLTRLKALRTSCQKRIKQSKPLASRSDVKHNPI